MAEVERDLYPSRVAQTPSSTARKDPVVYGTPASGPLSAEVLAQYEREGYLVFDELLRADEVQRVHAAVEALRSSPSVLARPEAIKEPSDDGLRSIFRVHTLDETMSALVRDERLIALASQILGGPVYVHQSRINFKPAFVGKEFYWHSDFETWHVEDGLPRMRALSISINLTDSNEHNGPLMVIPGSHHRFVSCVGETPENHYQESLRRQTYGVPDRDLLSQLAADMGIVAPKGRAGSLVLFDCNLMHGSSSNISPYPRCSVFIVYNSLENAPHAPYGGRPPRPDFIASRELTPLTAGA